MGGGEHEQLPRGASLGLDETAFVCPCLDLDEDVGWQPAVSVSDVTKVGCQRLEASGGDRVGSVCGAGAERGERKDAGEDGPHEIKQHVVSGPKTRNRPYPPAPLVALAEPGLACPGIESCRWDRATDAVCGASPIVMNQAPAGAAADRWAAIFVTVA